MTQSPGSVVSVATNPTVGLDLLLAALRSYLESAPTDTRRELVLWVSPKPGDPLEAALNSKGGKILITIHSLDPRLLTELQAQAPPTRPSDLGDGYFTPG